LADTGSAPWRRLTWALIAAAIVLRVNRFWVDPSLWFDEAALACNILDRSFLGLLQPLDDAQVAPVGYTALSKLLALALGDSEYVLRLLPLLAGITAVFLFERVARATLRPGAVPIAVGLFALSGPLIRYSAEVKQYSTDVAIGLLLLLVGLRIWSAGQARTLGASMVIGLGALGAAAVWFSQPSVFILAGIGSTLVLAWWRAGRADAVARLSLAIAIWLCSFGLLYWLVLRHALANEFLAEFWGGSDEPGSPAGGTFMPLPPTSFTDLRWFGRAFTGLFSEVAGLQLVGVAILAFVVGAAHGSGYALGRMTVALLLSPLLLALLASGFDVYPFYGRLLLFGLPGLLLVMAGGAGAIVARSRPGLVTLGVTLLALLFFQPVASARAGLLPQRPKWEARGAIQRVARERRTGDLVYVYYGGQTQMRYYARRVGLTADQYVLGVSSRDDFTGYERDLDALGKAPRVWVILSHYLPDELTFFTTALERRGKRLDEFRSGNVLVYLYDFSGH